MNSNWAEQARVFYYLTKPRMVYMNVLVAVAAFIFGSGLSIHWGTLFITILGLGGVVASACVFNNYADRFIDARMERTKKRALVTGNIDPKHALIFAAVLIVLGALLLYTVNWLTLGAALIGFFTYVLVYTPLKHRSGYALYVGAVAGAMPPVVGYVAATNTLDYWALALFTFLFVWQIPHFLAIARFRYDEYHAAGVPLLVERPLDEHGRRLARKRFHYSLVVLLVFCGALILQRWII